MLSFASRTIVTFGSGDTLTDAAARDYNRIARMDVKSNQALPAGFDSARYAAEMVRIYLGTATRPVGQALQYGP